MFAEREFYPFNLRLVLLLREYAAPQMHRRNKYSQNARYIQYIVSEGYVERLLTHIGIRTDQVTCNVFLYQSHQSNDSQARPHPPSQRRLPSTLNPEQHVPDPHCNHLILELSIHLRQRHRSLQEEDQERSPFPSTARQTPEL